MQFVLKTKRLSSVLTDSSVLMLFMWIRKNLSSSLVFATRRRPIYSLFGNNWTGIFGLLRGLHSSVYRWRVLQSFVLARMKGTKTNSASSFTSQVGESPSDPILWGSSWERQDRQIWNFGLSSALIPVQDNSVVLHLCFGSVVFGWSFITDECRLLDTSLFTVQRLVSTKHVRHRLHPKTKWRIELRHCLLYLFGWAWLRRCI